MKRYSPDEYKKKYGEGAYQTLLELDTQQAGPQKTGFFGRLKDSAVAGFQKARQGFSDVTQEGQSIGGGLSGFARLGAGVVETAASPLTAAAQPVIEPTIGKGIEFIANKISDLPSVQKFAVSDRGEFASRLAEDLVNVGIIASAAPAGTGASRAATTATRAAEEAARRIALTARSTGQKIGQTATKVGESIGSSPLVQEAKRIPSRIGTNIAERQAIQQSIDQLPTQVARQAAQDGLDVVDVQTLYNLPKSQTATLKELATVVKDFSEGKTKTNPIEVVGRPIVARIKELEAERTRVGKQLGEASNNLGEVTTEELVPAIIQPLQKVSGLQGLKLTPRGNLDFSDTVIASSLSNSDQVAIQEIFNEAVKAGTGKSKHLLRQELFEILGGKKKALTNLTDTQERAYNAIRQGLSDILENKNNSYKTLSNEYRKIIQPLQDIRSYMKKVVGADEDILDMSAGLLARRITSAAKSNPEIRNVLNAMDAATAEAGTTRLSIEALQDFYNILEKYYDIAPKTGFQAQVRRGVEDAGTSGLFNYVAKTFTGFAGETPAVRRQALEKILKEIFEEEGGPSQTLKASKEGTNAVKILSGRKSGEIKNAFFNSEIGNIDLTWGTTKGEGGGLSKIIQDHPEVVNRLDNIIKNAKVVGGREGRIYMETSDGFRIVVRTDFNEKPKQWLLTAYKKGR